MSKMYFHPDRLFYQSSEDENRAGWYFETRERKPGGPFPSREMAQRALEDYLIKHGDGNVRSRSE